VICSKLGTASPKRNFAANSGEVYRNKFAYVPSKKDTNKNPIQQGIYIKSESKTSCGFDAGIKVIKSTDIQDFQIIKEYKKQSFIEEDESEKDDTESTETYNLSDPTLESIESIGASKVSLNVSSEASS